jgi:hypothetical protein
LRLHVAADGRELFIREFAVCVQGVVMPVAIPSTRLCVWVVACVASHPGGSAGRHCRASITEPTCLGRRGPEPSGHRQLFITSPMDAAERRGGQAGTSTTPDAAPPASDGGANVNPLAATQFTAWYPHHKAHSLRGTSISLPAGFLAFLQEDGVFLPDDTAAVRSRSRRCLASSRFHPPEH